MRDKVFVVPNNDLEAKAIISLLKDNGYEEGKDLFITNQGWGASWENLEPEIKDALKTLAQRHEVTHYVSTGYAGGSSREVIKGELPEIVDVSGKKDLCGFCGYTGPVKALTSDFSNIYGVELQGKTPCNNIDHHVYGGDDRSNKKSSIEQVAELIGVELSVEQQFIAANDKGFIPAMEQLAEALWMSDEEKSDMINHVRYFDRQAQGITHEQEIQAEDALKTNLYKYENGLIVVELPHSKCATVTDRLYGTYDNLLIICGDGELDFYGDGKICQDLQKQFEGWSGGNLPESGFWGGYANKDEILQAIEEELAQEIDKDIEEDGEDWANN